MVDIYFIIVGVFMAIALSFGAYQLIYVGDEDGFPMLIVGFLCSWIWPIVLVSVGGAWLIRRIIKAKEQQEIRRRSIQDD